MTLETQYRKFLEANQKLKLSFEEWKKVNARLVKQALINMMKDDEELGLYDQPKQNWYHDGKIIDGKQERSYNEEEVLDIAKQAFVLGKDFGLIGTFNEWFETVKKK
jgi:hypothetical protein